MRLVHVGRPSAHKGSKDQWQTARDTGKPVEILAHLTGTRSICTALGDAISINQDDLVEKGHQVSIIGQIFFAAVMTRVWLGEAADDSNRYMEAIAGPGLLSCPDENKFLGRARIILVGESACYNPSAAERNYMQEHPNCKSWHAMVVRPYWSRTWIVQEILLSENLEIHCGNRKLPWDVFWGFQSSIPNNHLQYNSQVVGGSSAEHLSRERSRSGKRDLFNLVMDCPHRTDCADFRDKVYALLPLVPDTTKSKRLKVDYSIDSIELLFKAYEYSFDIAPSITTLELIQMAERLGLTPGDLVEAVDRRPHLLKSAHSSRMISRETFDFVLAEAQAQDADGQRGMEWLRKRTER